MTANSMPITLYISYHTRNYKIIVLCVFAINKRETNRDFNFTGRMNGFVFKPASEINSNKFPVVRCDAIVIFQHNCIQMCETYEKKRRKEWMWDDGQFRKQKRTPQTIITNYHLLLKHLYRAAIQKLMRSSLLSMVYVSFTWFCGHLFYSRWLIETNPNEFKVHKTINKIKEEKSIWYGHRSRVSAKVRNKKRWINIFIQAGDANLN